MTHFQLRLSGRQREALYRRLRSARQRGDQRSATRVLVILGLSEGYTIGEVAVQHKVSEQTVRNGVKSFLLGGVEGLLYRAVSPGRPAKLSREQRRELAERIEAGPQASGFVGGCWRSPMIQALIEERFGVQYSARYLSALLRSMGFSYQKAGFESDHLDEVARSQWLKQTWPQVQALAAQKNAQILFGDEASFPPWGTLSYTWARGGRQPVVKTCGRRKGDKVWGLIDYWTGRFFYQCQDGRLNSAGYEAFLCHVLSQTRKHIILIHDGVRYHTSAAMKTFFERRSDRLTVFQLPSYSPDFNPIETLWKKVKEHGTHLCHFPTFDALKDKVEQALLEFKHAPGEGLSLFVKMKTDQVSA